VLTPVCPQYLRTLFRVRHSPGQEVGFVLTFPHRESSALLSTGRGAIVPTELPLNLASNAILLQHNILIFRERKHMIFYINYRRFNLLIMSA
jgi:hypothetical protein